MKFDVVYADPAWEFRNQKTGGSHKSGARQKYDVMKLGAICGLPVGAISHPGTVLFLWTPTTMKFSHAPAVAQAWGFPNYITTIYWNKERKGMGFYFRNCVEELLVFGTSKGSVTPFGCQRTNLITCPPGEHSEKPEEFRKLIEDATGKISRRQCVELFARKKVPGWTPVGNQVTGRDIRDDLRLLAAGDDGMAWP
jgi:N6-adenosine-specific RNA methylase IME4